MRAQHVYTPLGYEWGRFPKQEDILRFTDEAVDTILIAGGVGASKSFTSAYYVLPEIVLAEVWRLLNGWQPQRLISGGQADAKAPLNPKFETTNVWIAGADYKQPRKEWQFLFDAITRNPYLLQLCDGLVGRPVNPDEGPWAFELGNGVKIETKSWENPDSFHSEKVHLMIAAEAGLLTEWNYTNRLQPRVVKAHGLMVMNGTFETTKGPFFTDKYLDARSGGVPGVKAFAMASWDNVYDYPGGIDDPAFDQAKRDNTHERFMERYGAEPLRPVGLVHAYFDNRVHLPHPQNPYVRQVEYDARYPVLLGVDPSSVGYGVLACQVKGEGKRKSLYVFDEFYAQGAGTTERAIRWIIGDASKNQPPKVWANKVAGGAIDWRTPEQRATWTGGAVWQSNNATSLRGVRLGGRSVPVDAGVERVNTLLHSADYDEDEATVDFNGHPGVPRIFINPRCRNLIREMSKDYMYPRDSATGDSKRQPLDRKNDLCKALAYLCVELFGFAGAKRRVQQAVHQPLQGVRVHA